MKNPFKKKEELSSIVPEEVIVNSSGPITTPVKNNPIITNPLKSSPSINTPIQSNPSLTAPILTMSSGTVPIRLQGSSGMQGAVGMQGSVGVTGVLGIQGITGSSGWGFSSAATYTYMDPEEVLKRRKAELMKEFEQNPELFSEIIVELRKQKIRQIKENAKPV